MSDDTTFTPEESIDEYVPRQITANDLEGSFEDAISGTMVEVEDGQIVTGTVVKVDKDEVLLDIGYKSEGVIPSRELSIRNDVDPSEIVSLGDEIEALVLQKEDKEGRLVLSKKRAQYERAWGDIEKIKEVDGVVKGLVIEVVKGGLILDIGLRGFLPASLVELRRVRDLQPYVGRTLEAKIIELDKNRNNVVLSRRGWLEETQKEQREEFLANLKPGEVRKGVVSSVVNFGAFVDLGGMDGLVHVSELSWKHVDHPSSVVQVGDEIEVQVLDVDLDKERISLSLKATQQDPWQEFASSHRVGELVYGRVTKLVPFGAFVQVGEGIEGLVHISEMSQHHVDLPEQVVNPAEELWVKIIDLDLQRRRISLSIKQAAEGGEVAAEYQQHFGEHAYDEQGNYIGTTPEHDPEADKAWAEYYEEHGIEPGSDEANAAHAAAAAEAPEAESAEQPVESAVAETPVDETPDAGVGDGLWPIESARVKLIGLTGGIGAGKSTVSARLRERGAVVVDADAITKELQQPGTDVFAAMVARFGDGILAADGTLDRQAVADIVFNDPEELVALSSIVHPAVGKEILRRIQERTGTDDVVVLDVPLLGKNGLYQVAGVLVVDTPIETAIRRLVELRGMDEADARARVANQISREERVAGADMVIDNSGAEADLDAQIDAVWAWIQSMPDWTAPE